MILNCIPFTILECMITGISNSFLNNLIFLTILIIVFLFLFLFLFMFLFFLLFLYFRFSLFIQLLIWIILSFVFSTDNGNPIKYSVYKLIINCKLSNIHIFISSKHICQYSVYDFDCILFFILPIFIISITTIIW